MLNLQWQTQEQEFLHQRVMMDAKKLSKEELLQIFEGVHKQYLLQSHLFARLASWCASNKIILPSFEELLTPKEVHHPEENN
jgi:thiol-disulfide isomerase/thioredoxin